jgi:hypothetical protein
MFMRARFFAFAALALPACAHENDAPSATENEVVTAPHGYYRSEGHDRADRWINEVNIHADGIYEADFGTNLSSVSGHHYRLTGRYRTAETGGQQQLIFDNPYTFRERDGVLEIKFGGPESEQPFLRMRRQPAPASITFAADGTVKTDGTLHAGGTALIRYEAARAHCGPNGVTGIYQADTQQWPIWMDFGENGTIEGVYATLVGVPEGHDLAIWFHQIAPACDHWDSAFGANYHFPIQP